MRRAGSADLAGRGHDVTRLAKATLRHLYLEGGVLCLRSCRFAGTGDSAQPDALVGPGFAA
jgi:hypothetical protein